MRAALLLLGILGCRPAGTPERPVVLMLVQRGGAPAFAVFPAAGVQINAHQAPALELGGDSVIRIDRGSVTRDSAYFAEPPWAPRRTSFSGTARLRVSYCRTREAVCQSERLTVQVEPSSGEPNPDGGR